MTKLIGYNDCQRETYCSETVIGHYIKNKTFDSSEEKEEDKKREKKITKQIGSTLT